MLVLLGPAQPSFSQLPMTVPLEEPPIEYSKTKDENRVSKLGQQLEQGELTLERHPVHGYLPAVLEALKISPSSQTLVFSKTSLQIRHISPRNPRAVYFNEDTYLGWVRGSPLLEISTTDPKLGAAFYLMDTSGYRPKIKRAGYDCLGCHATSMTKNVPGHALRSVQPNGDGRVETRHTSNLIELRTPFEQRFGGWYVTGLHGNQRHLGNAFVRGESLDTSRNSNIRRLEFEFDTRQYLSPHSDIVALTVLAHQVELHNAFTKADFQIRKLKHDQAKQHLALLPEEKKLQLQRIAQNVVDQLLFYDEQPLTDPLEGLADFQTQFVALAAKDSRGRSLRDFDLQSRLFRYPCSYLIYSDAFDALDSELRTEILQQLISLLRAPTPVLSRYPHLTFEVRSAIYKILQDTHKEFQSLLQR